MMERLLHWLLCLANADPPMVDRQQFYAIKHRLLKRYATLDGYDAQRIRKPCWSCDGTGIYDDSGRDCRRCWGSGVYSERWWRLDRYRWRGSVFHVPNGSLPLSGPTPQNTIQGHVQHRWDRGRLHDEAALWLALFFDRKLFWRMMTCGSPCGWTGYLLCTLNQVAYAVASRWRECKREIHRRRTYRPMSADYDEPIF